MRRRALLTTDMLGYNSGNGGNNGDNGGGDSPAVPIIDINNYLTIYALEDGLTASLSVNQCEYCVDGDGNWKTLEAGVDTESINTGQLLSFRGNLIPNQTKGIGTFIISKKCNLLGNCMSMLFGNSAVAKTSLDNFHYAFYRLFNNCKNVINISKDFLPATTLGDYCYTEMFQYCTLLETAPELPATTLKHSCYERMFYHCTSLTTAPELPATTLNNSCYLGMFSCCTSLINAPKLPATTILGWYCYRYMFYRCTSLTIAPELPATTLDYDCYSEMFNGCTSLTTAPELPATNLKTSCYAYMFVGCKNLSYIKMLATNISAPGCLESWVDGVAVSGTFVKNKNATWDVVGVNGIPRGWTIQTE